MTNESTIRARELAQQLRATTIAFLRDRLNDRSSIEWALELDSQHAEERKAVRDLLTLPDVKVKEPFRSAWFWLLESWSARPQTDHDSQFRIQHRIRQSGIDGDALRQVVDLVRPWPRLKKLESWRLYGGPAPPKVPRKLGDLVSISMSGGDLITLRDVGLQDLVDTALGDELANRLEAALLDGLYSARRLGWIDGGVDRTNYDVRRVYRVPSIGTGDDEEPDPDSYRHGFAPVIKLLYEVVDLLGRSNAKSARTHIAGWKKSEWPLLRRLWAGLARGRELVSADELADFFASLTDEQFWKPIEYPEFAELRARRFDDMNEAERLVLETRIRALPPGSLWTRKPAAKDLLRYRHVRAAIELKRILAAGGHISDASRSWLADVAAKYEVPNVDAVDFDLEPAALARWMPEGTEAFDATDLRSALSKLETAFGKTEWDDNANAAQSYVRAHLSDLLELFSESPELATKSPGVWRQILQLQRPAEFNASQDSTEAEEARNRAAESKRRAVKILELLSSLPDHALPALVDRLSGWMAEWAETLKTDPAFAALWLRAWPAAVETTNMRAPPEEDEIGELLGERESDRGERLATAALNTPAGVMMTAFLRMCPNLKDVPHPFVGDPLRRMREAAAGVSGPARLQVLHRFLSSLEYMRRADEEWTDRNLLDPLNKADAADIEIWDAVSRNPVLRYDTMRRIGKRMADVAHSDALPPDTRARLGERVVYRVLLDKNDGKEPSVADEIVQQMLRLGTDRLRTVSGRIIGVFVESEDRKSSREERFRNVVKPFLESVWPKERTLASRSLSNALAELPAKSGAAFAEAVDVIERFLTPFDCWSLHNYGLYGRDPDGKKLREVNDTKEAAALLKLLDITIGSEERAIHPLDLDRALVAIREADPKLVRDTRYARLSALVRR
jgi:hypothetical protein